jgi:hypothetical protein
VPEFYSGQGRLRRSERFKAEHRANYSFDKPVILLDNIIQIFTLPDFDPLVFVSIVLLDTGCIGTAFVDVDQAGLRIRADRFVEKSACGLRITLGCQQEIDGIAFLVDSAIEIFPLALDPNTLSSSLHR